MKRLCLMFLLIGLLAGDAAADSTSDARGRLNQVEALRIEKQYAAMESLATVVRMELEAAAQPDTALLAEALYQICQSRNLRRMLSDTVGVHAGTRSLELLDAASASPDTLRLNVLQALGWLYFKSGRSSLALDHYRPAIELARRHPEWPLPVGPILYFTGMSLIYVGQLDSALHVLGEALAQREPLNVPRDALIGDIHAGIATAYEKLEKSAPAEAAYAAAIRAHEERIGPDDPGITNALSRAAAFEFLRGDYSRSIDYNQRGLRIQLAQTPVSKLEVIIFRLSIAQGLEQLGDVPAARATYDEVMPDLEAWLGPGRPVVVAGWISLAGACQKLGDGDRALEIYRHVRDVFAADTLLSERLGLAAATVNMAMILSERGSIDSALAMAVEAEKISRSLPEVNLITIESFCTQLTIHSLRGDWESVDRVDAALQGELDRWAVRANNHSDDAWLTRSEVAERRGRLDEALSAAAEGARASRERLAWNVRALSDRQALLLANTVSRPLDRMLHLAAGADPETVRRVWDELVRTRGLVGIEISRRRLPPATATDTSFVQAHADWVRAQQNLAQQEVNLAASLHDAAAESLRDALRADVEECERRMVRDASAARPGLDMARVGLAEILAALAPGHALASFARAPDHDGFHRLLVLVSCGGSTPPRCLDLGPADSLEALVEAWKATLGEPDPGRRSEASCRRAGVAVANAIWEPIARATAGFRDLVIVPEAPVSGLPWGALPVGRADYLVESGPVIHILAAERGLVASPDWPVDGGLLAVGGVDFKRALPKPERTGGLMVANLRAGSAECDSLALSRLEALPGTAGEVEDVEAAWRRGPDAAEPVARLEGASADEAEFKRQAPGRRLLHIATHGLVLAGSCGDAAAGTRGVGGVGPIEPVSLKSAGERTNGSGKTSPGPRDVPSAQPVTSTPWLDRQVFLAFAGAAVARQHSEDENEGLLTAHEVATLDLRGTEWVVLSACHSAAGETWSRQGVLGMERAFHLAGARTVIASQWAVDDDSTREWMRALYEARARGAGSAGEAMTEAAREVLRERRAAGRPTHPFYWAAFTANGE